MYIATDSRISLQGTANGPKWDSGQKAYASASVPLILGCVGNGFYAPHIAPRVLSYAETIMDADAECTDLVSSIEEYISSALSDASGAGDPFTEFVLAFRKPDGEFWIGSIAASANSIKTTRLQTGEVSDIVHATGSGEDFVRHNMEQWRKTQASGTSRAVYSAFCDSLFYKNQAGTRAIPGQSKDPFSEAPPQLVGLYRKWAGRHFATVWKHKAYFGGVRVKSLPVKIECRNELFECCDPKTLARLVGAQPHVDEITVMKRQRGSR